MSNNFFRILIVLGFIWEILAFVKFPQQAWMYGFLESWYSSKGLLMYRDYLNTYTPFFHLVMIFLHKIFGYSQYVTISLALVRSLVAYCLLTVASYKWLKGYYRILPLLIYLLWDPFLSQNVLGVTDFIEITLFTTLILLWSWFEKRKTHLSFLIGLFSGISIMSSQIVVLSSLILFVYFLFIGIKNKKDFKYFVYFVAGFMLPIVIIFLWLFKNKIVGDFFFWTVKYNFSSYPRANLGKSKENLWIFISIHLPLLLYFYNLLIAKKINIKKIVTLVFAVSMPLTYWFAVFHIKRFQIDFLINAFLLGISTQAILLDKKVINKIIIAIVLLTNSFFFYKYALTKYTQYLTSNTSNKVVTLLYKDDPIYPVIEWLKHNTKTDDRLFVIADGLIYFESDRLPVNAKAVGGNIPFVYNPIEEYKKELEQKPPSYWVVDERAWDRWNNDFQSQDLTREFQKILNCEELVFQQDYVTIRKHIGGKGFCR